MEALLVALLDKEYQAIYYHKGKDSSEVIREERVKRHMNCMLHWELRSVAECKVKVDWLLSKWAWKFSVLSGQLLECTITGYVFSNRVADDADHTLFSCGGWDRICSMTLCRHRGAAFSRQHCHAKEPCQMESCCALLSSCSWMELTIPFLIFFALGERDSLT